MESTQQKTWHDFTWLGSRERQADILAFLALFTLSLFFFKNFIGTQTLMDNGHHLHEQTFFSYNYKAALAQGTLPLWTPYWYGGQPLFGDGQVFFLNLTHLFVMLFGIIPLAINLSILIYFFLAGAGMYLLGRHLFGNPGAAFIASLVFMFNGLIYQFIVSGNPSILEPYALIPFIFLCVLKAKKAESPFPFSIAAGALLAFQIFSGGAITFLYTILLIGTYLFFDLIRKDIKKNLIRTAVVFSILLAVFFGLSAVKVMPSTDFISQSNRAQGVSYQEYIGEDHFVLKDFLKIVVVKGETSSHPIHIGIAASLLALCSFLLFKRRMVAFLVILCAFIVLLASGGFLAALFYKYLPVFPQTRHIVRVMFVFVFCASLLAGYGYFYFLQMISRKFHSAGKSTVQLAIVVAVSAAILSELLLMKGLPAGFNVQEQFDQNEAAKFMGEQHGFFRITTFDVNDIISFYGSSYYAQYGLETLNGGGSLWSNDYVSFLGIAKNYGSTKLLGILNLRYALSTKPVNVSGYRLVQKFNECAPCKKAGWTTWIAGPYLYENLDFLPRYYLAPNAVLVIGDLDSAKQLTYALLLDSKFDPKHTVIVHGKMPRVNDYDADFLSSFKAVILAAGSVDQNFAAILQKYKEGGGIVLPDMLSGKNSIEAADIEDLLGSLNGSLMPVDAKRISPNTIEVTPKGPGILVLSEKFSLFDDWSAMQDGTQLEILRADTVISAVIVEKPGTIRFSYRPASFVKGAAISLLTLLIIFIYGAWLLWRLWAQKHP